MHYQSLTNEQITAFSQDLIAVRPALMKFGRHFSRQECDLDDLVQSTLLLAWTHLDMFTPGRSMKSWTCAILHNVFIDDFRKRRGHPAIDPDILIEQVAAQPTQEWSVRKTEVLAALDRMAPDCRQALLQMGLGQSYQDAALELGGTVGAMKTRVRRSRIELAAVLA